ncbi:MAG: type II CRISPR RNA-guided endonuclease Cas9, partial [Mogibacterium sp.]|nr:type II CRISPR RNA-guided endonuclease Cas9 [Mogibacterium sp.]
MKDYYLGLDVGTNSIGYAVTDTEYNLIKKHGEPMWGAHVFEEGSQSAERRGFRTARRRLNRRQQRVLLTQEIFAREISKVDEKFFVRIKESSLYREDKMSQDEFTLFNDNNYTDADYAKQYPTIHHLIAELMSSKEQHDPRLVYLAVSWIMAHRGHFLNDVDKNNIDNVLNLENTYNDFTTYLNEIEPDSCLITDGIDGFAGALKKKLGITKKEKELYELLNNGKKPKATEDTAISDEIMIKLLCGGKSEAAKLFPKKTFDNKISISLNVAEDVFAQTLAELDEDTELLLKLKAIYDWSLLVEILKGRTSLSEAKVEVYEQHKKDLKFLKQFIKKYLPENYNEIFRNPKNDKEKNYVAYSYNTKNANVIPKSKASKEEFCDYIKKIVKDVSPENKDAEAYADMMERLDRYSFMPKQVDGDNRVIPYQLYYDELKKILDNAKAYLTFLNEEDDGISNIDKLLGIFEFRIPYYVGPLNPSTSEFAWMKRKAEGPILPWNFEEKVDLDASEEAFIRRMTNKCTYLPGEDVLPKNSLLYSKFTVLNEINNIKINGISIDSTTKQEIYKLFENNKKVTVKRIKDYLASNGLLGNGDVISGLDITIKSSLKSYHDFKRLLTSGKLSEFDVEKIITRLTYSEDKIRSKKWLRANFKLPDEDIEYISKLKYNDFGRVSEKLLNGIEGVNKETGEFCTVIGELWNTSNNLMEIIASNEKYDFIDKITEFAEEYYGSSKRTTDDILSEMYISNAVKRPIFRTLDIVNDIRKATRGEPKKIFIEMARGGGEAGKRTKSRRDSITEYYSNLDKDEVRELSKQLEGKSDNELQSEMLFLYFMQLGRSLYSGKPIDIEKLKTDIYNVDHIYPQSKVKDDSFNNKALVLSTENGEKGDKYPISGDIQNKMLGFWKHLKDKGLMSEEKYKRLTRNNPFTEAEQMGFINRQLVETRQSTKALATILKNKFPNSEIVYVKAGLVSEFRKFAGITKCRQVNDLHHAKDAYLNVVVGNVYSSKFTKHFNT